MHCASLSVGSRFWCNMRAFRCVHRCRALCVRPGKRVTRIACLQVVTQVCICGTYFAAIHSLRRNGGAPGALNACLPGATVPLLRWPRVRGVFASFQACIVQCQFLIVHVCTALGLLCEDAHSRAEAGSRSFYLERIARSTQHTTEHVAFRAVLEKKEEGTIALGSART